MFSVCCWSIPTICVQWEHVNTPTLEWWVLSHSPQTHWRIILWTPALKTILAPRGPKKAWQIIIRIQSIWGRTKQILELVSKWSEVFKASNKGIYFEEKNHSLSCCGSCKPLPLCFHTLLFSLGRGGERTLKQNLEKLYFAIWKEIKKCKGFELQLHSFIEFCRETISLDKNGSFI